MDPSGLGFLFSVLQRWEFFLRCVQAECMTAVGPSGRRILWKAPAFGELPPSTRPEKMGRIPVLRAKVGVPYHFETGPAPLGPQELHGNRANP